MLLAHREDGSVWLDRRPGRGIWGGLWSPPEFESHAAAEGLLPGAADGLQLPPVQHAFTHFDLRILPLLAASPQGWDPSIGADAGPRDGLWYNPRRPARVGLPTPVASLLAALPELIEAQE